MFGPLLAKCRGYCAPRMHCTLSALQLHMADFVTLGRYSRVVTHRATHGRAAYGLASRNSQRSCQHAAGGSDSSSVSRGCRLESWFLRFGKVRSSLRSRMFARAGHEAHSQVRERAKRFSLSGTRPRWPSVRHGSSHSIGDLDKDRKLQQAQARAVHLRMKPCRRTWTRQPGLP